MTKILKGTLSDFWKSSLLQNLKNIEGGFFGDVKHFQKSLRRPKKSKGDPLLSSGFANSDFTWSNLTYLKKELENILSASTSNSNKLLWASSVLKKVTTKNEEKGTF